MEIGYNRDMTTTNSAASPSATAPAAWLTTRIPPRFWVTVLVVMIIGLGEPLYYKIQYAISRQVAFLDAFVAGWQEVAIGFLFALAVATVHESWRAIVLNRWPYGERDRLRQIVIFAGSVVYGAAVAASFVWLFYTVLNDYGFNPGAVVDMTFTAVLIPIAISGISESFGFRSAYVNERIAREEAGRAAADARYDALKNRLAPHFLFNSLGALAQTAAERPQAVERFVRALSDVYRYVLQTEGRDSAPLSEDWHAADALLAVQKERRPDTLTISVDIPERYSSRTLIPLSLLTLIENALKHNVSTRSQPLDIAITAHDDGITVRNAVQPVLSVESNGIGLDNLDQRFVLAGAPPVRVEQNDETFAVTLPWLPEQAQP